MSPLTLRRFRAERLLREEFQRLRTTVLAATRSRLAARGIELARADLEACYSLAWHGLYAAQLAGEQVESPAAWLTLVTFRRALDEHRARRHLVAVEQDDGRSAGEPGELSQAGERGGPRSSSNRAAERRDLAAELDDRARLAALFEGIREQLHPRERQAAVLCYLHGLSRNEAARTMGLTEPRMRRLMDGRGDGRPGVAAKVGALAETIEAGRWCEQRASLMRALAFGILDPGGERHLLALEHHRGCPACRAYVASLRGLAALLPPTALPPALLAGLAGSAGAGAGAGAGGGAAAGGGSGLAAAGAAGSAGGGWVLAGTPLGAKLAVGCLLLIGTGCAGIGAGLATGGRPHSPDRDLALARAAGTVAGRAAAGSGAGGSLEAATAATPGGLGGPGGHAAGTAASAGGGTASNAAAREFGLEGAAPGGSGEPSRARAASVGTSAPPLEAATRSSGGAGANSGAAAGASGQARARTGGRAGAPARPARQGGAAAAREFAPG